MRIAPTLTAHPDITVRWLVSDQLIARFVEHQLATSRSPGTVWAAQKAICPHTLAKNGDLCVEVYIERAYVSTQLAGTVLPAVKPV